MNKKRCDWVGTDELMKQYHDNSWGKPVHDDQKLFEFLTLEGAQAGLSWKTILYKQKNYQKAFDSFNYKKIAKYDSKKIKELFNNAGIVRNRLKINATIANAQKFIEVQKEFGSFDRYLWSFVSNRPIKNKFKTLKQIPASTKLSDKISSDLKKRGFKFVGSTIIYAYLQAVGVVNDHLTTCWRHKR